MKKILLSLMLIAFSFLGNAQAVFNELWYNPGTNGGNDEYIEIYNPGAPEEMDCYTILSYYNNGTDSGFVVINYPNNITLNSGHYSVLGSDNPVTHQGTPYSLDLTAADGDPIEDFNWADPNLVANGGYILDFRATGATYAAPTVPSDLNNVLRDLGNNANGANFITLLYRNGILVNAIRVGAAQKVVPAKLKTMPDLAVPSDGAGCAGFDAEFSTLTDNLFEYMTSGIGANNGVHRTADGRCGTWEKSDSPSEDTPGTTNGPSDPITGQITLLGEITCTATDGTRPVNYQVVNATTNPAAYPMVLLLYIDNGSVVGDFDAGDTFIEQQVLNVQADGDQIFSDVVPANKGAILIAKSTAGCFESIYWIVNSCTPLPVKFKSFVANRSSSSSVSITWTTASEENSKGFNIQRNVGGVWQTIAYVPSQAVNGTSTSDLTYSYTDANSLKGITQYRIQQVDLDGQAKYSDIRAIRGDGSVSKVVVYPNPSVDGKVNVVFEDNTGVRDVFVNDMQGKVIKSFRGITNNILVIDKLPSGFYTIRITNRNTAASSVEKVVVK